MSVAFRWFWRESPGEYRQITDSKTSSPESHIGNNIPETYATGQLPHEEEISKAILSVSIAIYDQHQT